MRTRRAAVVAASLAALAPGSHVAGAQQSTTPPASAGALSAMHGVVYDSLTRGPLARAYVQVVRTEDMTGGRTVTADSAGRFRIDSLAPGRYLVSFFHPLLDLLRVQATPRVVDLGLDDVRVDLGVPDLAGVRPVVCGSAQAPTDSTGLLAGRVRDSADGAPVVNAKVVLTWSEVAFGAGGVRTEHRRTLATTGPGGSYVLCGVPAGLELVASAAAPGRASGDVALEVPARGFVVRDLTLGDTLSDTPSGRVAHGTARLTGTVRDSVGRAIRGARATVWGTAVSATVDGDGAFTLAGLPAGTRMLEVRAIGFVVRRVPVDLAPGRTAAVDVRMQRAAVALGPVTVFGTPSQPSPLLGEFLERQRHNILGRFLTAADLDRTRPLVVTAALRGMPALRIVPDGHLGNTILGRGKNGAGTCRALVVLNGTVLQPGDRIDDYVSPENVGGIEVYDDPSSAPPQYFGGRMGDCSVVLVWTRQ